MRAVIAVLCLFCGLSFSAPVLAQANTDFTFKRVKPPTSGSRKLINIQVEPVAAPERALAYIPDVPDVAPLPSVPRGVPGGAARAEWFWGQLSPDIRDAKPGRMRTAVAALASAPGGPASLNPSEDQISRILDQYGSTILLATAGTPVSPALVVAVISVESAGRPAAESPVGAVGLMQLMPATAKRFGVSDRTNPQENIRGGVEYLTFLLDEFDGDALLALAAYNAGEGAVARHRGVPDFAETRNYVPKVVGAWQSIRLRCLEPPERATDGCLFTGIKLAGQ